MHWTLWLLTSLAVSPVLTQGDVPVDLKGHVAGEVARESHAGDGSDFYVGPMQGDACGNWRLTGLEHCRWMYGRDIDAYLACVRAIERMCEDQERAQSQP